MNIYFVRHTTPEIYKGVCYGHSDLDVNADFEKELEIIKNKIGGCVPHFVYSSPLKRCLKLAKKLNSHGVSLVTDTRLKELDFGDWEMQKWNDIPKPEMTKWGSDFINQAPPNGESFAALYERATSFLDEIKMTKDKDLFIVTHSGVIRSFLAHELSIPKRNAFVLKLGYGEVVKLTVNGDFREIEFL